MCWYFVLHRQTAYKYRQVNNTVDLPKEFWSHNAAQIICNKKEAPTPQKIVSLEKNPMGWVVHSAKLLEN